MSRGLRPSFWGQHETCSQRKAGTNDCPDQCRVPDAGVFPRDGTIAQPLDPELTLVRTSEIDPSAPPDALVIGPDGAMSYRGAPVADASAYLALTDRPDDTVIRVVPDRDLPAAKLIEIGAALQAGGAERVMIVTERDAQ